MWLALGATTLGLVAGFLLKDQCATHPWADAFQYRRLCYNDLQPLYEVRGIRSGLLPYLDVVYEYPPLTGIFMDLVGRLLRWLHAVGLVGSAGNENYFRLSSLLLAPFAYAITLLLRTRVTKGRLLLWAIGTPIVLYSFHNWDLIAVAGGVWGIAAYEKSRHGMSGGALGLGAAAKLYPAFIAPAILLDRWSRADRKAAFRFLISIVVVFVLVNLPFIVLARGVPPVLDRPDWAEAVRGLEIRSPADNGWVRIWTFHAGRYPDFGTVWYWIAHHGRALVDSDAWRSWWQVPAEGQPAGFRDSVSVTSLLLFLLGSVAFLWRGWQRRDSENGYPVVATSLGIVVVFLLVSKVHSPQYALWVVPFLAMLDVPWKWVLGYLAADLLVYVSGFYWFTVFDSPTPGWKGIFEVAVLLRAAALGALAWAAWRANRLFPNISSRPSDFSSHPA